MKSNAAKRFENWKNFLLDTSKTNKLINFRPTQKTNVEIIFPDFEKAVANFMINGLEGEFMHVFNP